MAWHVRKLQLWESRSSFARVLQEIFPKASTILPLFEEIFNNHISKLDSFKSTLKVLYVFETVCQIYDCNWLLISILPVWWRKHHVSGLEPWKFSIWTQVTNMCPNSLPFRLVCWGQPFKTKQEDYINWISPKRIIAASSECWLRPAAFACCHGEDFKTKKVFSEESHWCYWWKDDVGILGPVMAPFIWNGGKGEIQRNPISSTREMYSWLLPELKEQPVSGS